MTEVILHRLQDVLRLLMLFVSTAGVALRTQNIAAAMHQANRQQALNSGLAVLLAAVLLAEETWYSYWS